MEPAFLVFQSTILQPAASNPTMRNTVQDAFENDDGAEGSTPEVDRGDFIVLGEELARATAAEELRKAQGELELSPMPEQVYDYWRGETSLIRPVALPLDSAIAELCKRFAAADERAREHLRSAISMDEFYTLLTFARRSAVFAIRGRDANWVEAGMTAVAMIDSQRVDYRDILVALSLLHHAARRIGIDVALVFRQTAARCKPDTASLVAGYADGSDREKDIRSSWGYDEVQTSSGVGFIGWGFETYEPTYDLKAIAIEIADYLATDKYLPSSVEVATVLPAVWLQIADRAALDQAMKSIRAVAQVTGSLRPEESPNYSFQHFIVFLAELATEAAAQNLLEIARQKNPSGYCMIPLAEGRLFLLIVARSFAQGIEAFETQQTMRRFAQPMMDILRRRLANEVLAVTSREPARWSVWSALRRLASAIRKRR